MKETKEHEEKKKKKSVVEQSQVLFEECTELKASLLHIGFGTDWESVQSYSTNIFKASSGYNSL